MIKVGEQGIFLSDDAAKKVSPYILSQLKKTLVLNLNSVQSSTETDPAFTAWLATPPNLSTFTNDAGYLTFFSETDPIFSLWQSTYDNHADWDTAYGWGNHASAGYLTGITSGDVTTALGYTPYNATNPSGYITSSSLTGYLQNNVGISGGTTLIGGTLSGNNLTLSSTSNATKGKILFGTSAYDEVNNRLGIGTTTPLNKLDVYGDLTIGNGAGAALKYNSTVAGGGSEFVIQPIYSGTSIVSLRPAAGSSLAPALRLTDSLTDAGGSHAFSFGTGSASLPANVWNFFSTITGNANTNSWPIYFGVSNPSKGRVVAMTIDNTTNVGIGTISPTAVLHLKAGTATANTAPLKFTTGTNTTVAVAGQIEYNNTFHLTNSDATRRHIVTAPNTTKVTASAPYTNDGYIVVNIAGTDFKILTTA